MRWDALSGVRLTREQMEKRRLLATANLQTGIKQVDVARKYGVSRASVSRWAGTFEEKGLEGLKMQKATGQPPKLGQEDLQRLAEILVGGPQVHGWKTDLWTAKRVAEVIWKEFRVRYHPHHVPKLLHRIGFRPVKPKRQAVEKDEKRKQEWLATTWVQVKKT